MFKHLIVERSPHDDYEEIQKHAVYTIKNVDYDHWKTYDNYSKTRKSTLYNKLAKVAKILLIVDAIILVSMIVLNLLFGKMDNSETKKHVSLAIFLVMLGLFVTAAIIGFTLAGMESFSQKKDKVTRNIQLSKTWILNNGYIAVAEGKGVGSYQLLTRTNLIEKKRRMSCEDAASKIDIIYKVNSVAVKNGKIVADVKKVVLDIYFPFIGSYTEGNESDEVFGYFQYFQKKCRGIEKWDADIQDASVLMQALEALKGNNKFRYGQ